MFSAHYNSEPESAADHAFTQFPRAEGRLGNSNYIHFLSQPSRSTKNKFKRAINSCGNVRFHHTSTVMKSNIFMIGGQCSLDKSNTSLAKSLLKMDFSTLVVNEKDSTIVPVTGHGAVPINDSKILILFGKESIAPPKLTNIVQQMDVQTGVVNTLDIKGTAPSARYAHTVVLIDDKVYIIGGINKDNDVLGEINFIDLISNSWNIITSKNSLIPIAGHSTVVVEKKYLISCFGFNNKHELRNDCNVFDTINKVYIQPNISGIPPSPRSYSSMVTKDDDDKKIYIFGGFDKDYKGNNELHVLDVTNIRKFTWSSVSYTGKHSNLIPSPRGAHTAIIKSEMMYIWGGYSDADLSDSEPYIFDVKSNTWIDKNLLTSSFSNDNNNNNDNSNDNNISNTSQTWQIIVGIVGAIVITLMAIFCLLIFRRRRLKVTSIEVDKEIQNDPYNRSVGKFGGNLELSSSDESKVMKSIDLSILEQITVESISPSQLPLDEKANYNEKESPKSSEVHPNYPKDLNSFRFSSDKNKLNNISSKRTSTDSQRIKRSHRRTSSVSLTPADVADLTRPRSFVHHKSSLSTSVINNSTFNHSYLNNSNNSIPRKSSPNESDPISESNNNNNNNNHISKPLDILSALRFETNNLRDSKATFRSARSVNSLQWVGFNTTMMADQEEKRLSLHVRNAFGTIHSSTVSSISEGSRTSSESESDEYVICGDYINTTPKFQHNIGQGNSKDDGLQKRSISQNQSKIKNNRNIISNIVEEEDNSEECNRRESGIIDNYMHNSRKSSDNNNNNNNDNDDSDDKRSSKKSKRSSNKRASRVSFALTDEKIEYYETESSESVSLARISGRTSSSSSNSIPSIIEEEEEEETDSKDNKKDGNEEVLKIDIPEPVSTTVTISPTNSIKEFMREQGIHEFFNI